jgi:hypothetical protein
MAAAMVHIMRRSFIGVLLASADQWISGRPYACDRPGSVR